MHKRLRTMAAELTKVARQIKRDLERAETHVGEINQLIDDLATSGALRRAVLLGKHREIPADPDAPPADGGRLIQAALLVPEGLGVCVWDSEQESRDQERAHFDRDAREKFMPFSELQEMEMLFVLPQIEALLEELLAIAEAASSSEQLSTP